MINYTISNLYKTLLILILSFLVIASKAEKIGTNSTSLACDFADSCEDALLPLLTLTQEDCLSSVEYLSISGCLDQASPGVSTNCAENLGPTVWFQIEIDDPNAVKLITQVDAPGFDAVWSIYEGTSCADLSPVAEQDIIDGLEVVYSCSNSDGELNNIFQTPIGINAVTTGIRYWVAITAIGEITDPNFDFYYTSTLECLACNGYDAFDANNGTYTASIMQDGEWVEVGNEYPFCQGMDVQVCLDFNYDTSSSGNDWLHGFVPVFGSGWEVSDAILAGLSSAPNFEFFEAFGDCAPILNGYDLPNVCTYMEDGVLKLCNSACDATCPCSGGSIDGQALPSGYWLNSDGGTPTCGTFGCSPASFWGSPNGTVVDVNLCFELKTKVFDSLEECEEKKSLQVIVQTFSDAITGCWDDANPCIIDPSLQGPSWEIECNEENSTNCENPIIPNIVDVCNFDSGIDSTCINFVALATGIDGIWSQDDIIPGFNFSGPLDNVCFDGVLMGCYPFTFSTTSPELPPTSTVLVCVNPCPCPSPATMSIPDLCTIDMFNLKDAQLTLDTGSWSVIDGPIGQDFTDIIIDDIFLAHGILAGSYVVRFTLDNPGGPLCETFSEQTINVIEIEQINVIENGLMCNIDDQQFPTSLDLFSLIDVDNTNGGTWLQTGTEPQIPITNGSIISSDDVFDYSQTFTFVYTSPSTGGPCPSTETEVLVDILDCSCPMLLVSSASVCNEGSVLDLNSLLTNNDNLPGTWSTDGNLQGLNIFDPTGLTSGVYIVTYTLDSSSGPDCPLEYSNTIIVHDQPTAELNLGPEPCSIDTGNGPTAINLYNWLQSDYTLGSWTQTSGNILVLSDDGINTAVVDFVGQNIGDQFTFLFTTTGAQDPCTDVSVEVNIIVVDCNCPPVELSDPMPIFNDLGSSDLCSLIGFSDSGTFTAFNQAGEDASANINSAGCIFDATGIEAETYTIVYTLDLPVSGSCVQADTVFLEVLQFVSTNSIRKENIQIHPNPTTDKLYIKSEYRISAVELYTTTGKNIYQTQFPNVYNAEIDLSIYPSGLYILQVETENGRWVEKVVKQ